MEFSFVANDHETIVIKDKDKIILLKIKIILGQSNARFISAEYLFIYLFATLQ